LIRLRDAILLTGQRRREDRGVILALLERVRVYDLSFLTSAHYFI
jgi:hypothetical protein